MPRLLKSLLAAFLVVLCAASVAVAKPKEKTEITVRSNDNFEVVGQVKSVRACEPGRALTLMKGSDATGREVVASTRSKQSGRYSFGRVVFELDANYTVKAAKRSRSRVICKGARKRLILR